MQIGGHDSRIYGQEALVSCPNCQHRFPTDKFDIHQAYCSRNFKKCQMCGIMVDKTSLAQHQKQNHSMKVCEFCLKQCMGRQLEIHQQQCLAKPEICNYCNKPCPKGQMKNHQQNCGLRKKQCELCKKLYPIKQLSGHIERCENRRRERRQNSQQQHHENREEQGRRHIFRQNSENQLITKSKQKQEANRQQPRRKIKSKNVIARQQIKPQISPVPISIQLTIRQKDQNKSGKSVK